MDFQRHVADVPGSSFGIDRVYLAPGDEGIGFQRAAVGLREFVEINIATDFDHLLADGRGDRFWGQIRQLRKLRQQLEFFEPAVRQSRAD